MRREMSVISQKHVLSADVTASKLDIFSIAAFLPRSLRFPLFDKSATRVHVRAPSLRVAANYCRRGFA